MVVLSQSAQLHLADLTDGTLLWDQQGSKVSARAERSMNRPTFALTLPSDMRMLSVARTFVEAVCQACNLERAMVHALVLATGEAVTNIVRHAHRDLPVAEMQIHLELRADGVALSFLDQGQPFDIAAVPQLPPPPGARWRINLYRLEHLRRTQIEGQAFSPVFVGDFHHLPRFGWLQFD